MFLFALLLGGNRIVTVDYRHCKAGTAVLNLESKVIKYNN
jgi:hypothetical protein